MRILHVIPGDNFTEGMAYKDNFLSAINAADGHDVLILSSCKTWVDGRIKYVDQCDLVMQNGVRLIRRTYKNVLNPYVSSKLRVLNNAYDVIEDFKPDVIRVLNPHNFTLPYVVKYKKIHPEIKLYVDSHQDFYNSGKGWFSYWVFHKFLVRRMMQKSLKYIDKVFYCLEGAKEFLKTMYGIPDEKLEFFPMGGTILDEESRLDIRKKVREQLNVPDDCILMVHSGKLDELKRTREILEALQSTNSSSLRLVIVGNIPEEMKPILMPLIQADNRVNYLGWKPASELSEYLCAGDLYLQPGTASATIFQALCSSNAVVVAPDIKGYEVFMPDAGWYGSSKEDLRRIFMEIIESPDKIKEKRRNALSTANEYFDYRKLAARLYE
jgi:glycosyltransferase involved in cell wall biosynthesis